jgi:hypothetical protein
MKLIIGAAFTVLWAVNVAADPTLPNVSRNSLVTWETYEEIKSKATTWTPFTPDQHPFRDYTDEELSRMTGKLSFANQIAPKVSQFLQTIDDGLNFLGINTASIAKGMQGFLSHDGERKALAASFDGRSTWSTCMHPVR